MFETVEEAPQHIHVSGAQEYTCDQFLNQK